MGIGERLNSKIIDSLAVPRETSLPYVSIIFAKLLNSIVAITRFPSSGLLAHPTMVLLITKMWDLTWDLSEGPVVYLPRPSYDAEIY